MVGKQMVETVTAIINQTHEILSTNSPSKPDTHTHTDGQINPFRAIPYQVCLRHRHRDRTDRETRLNRQDRTEQTVNTETETGRTDAAEGRGLVMCRRLLGGVAEGLLLDGAPSDLKIWARHFRGSRRVRAGHHDRQGDWVHAHTQYNV